MWAVRADDTDPRAWLQVAPICPALRSFRIAHLGEAEMPAPFEIVRAELGGSYFLSTLEGSGRVLVDGRWKPCLPGEGFLLPPGTLHAFHTPTGETWRFCWVRYEDGSGRPPVAAAGSPVLAKFAGDALHHAIRGLYAEVATGAPAPSAEAWASLIHGYVRRFALPARIDPRLIRLWDRVAADLAHPWTNAEMARAAAVSEKHLERLSRQHLGRTPRQQLIWLRMSRAAELLSRPSESIESVAAKAGYQNAFVFSATFKRIMGWSPSKYPGRR
jgi:AraC-like DNA-binding protein